MIGENDRLIPISAEVDSARTHVLLEFTGFRCVNCPTAAETAHELQSIYGERLIVVSLHPASNPFTQGKYDYTCSAADSVYQFMGGMATTPFPAGNIDIAKVSGNYFIDPAEWGGQLLTAMADTVCPSLSAEAEIDTITRLITVTTYAYADSTLDAQLAIWVTEDSIHGMQAMPDGTANTDYIHRHVLRTTAFDSPWGTAIRLENMVAPRHTTFTLPGNCNAAQCHIVALLLDINDYHILQAYETTLDTGSHP